MVLVVVVWFMDVFDIDIVVYELDLVFVEDVNVICFMWEYDIEDYDEFIE